MNKAAALADKLGANIEQSIGKRDNAPLATNKPASDVIPMATPDQGRTRLRDAGAMEIERIISDPNQPRKIFNKKKLEELCKSISTFGVLQPIVIRWSKNDGKHIIVAGERRYRAAKMADLTEIPCIFSNDGTLPEEETILRQLTENIQRDDLSPMEAARAFEDLQKKRGWSAVQIAESLSISKGLVSQRLKLLALPEDIQTKVDDGTLSGAHGYQLAKVKDPDEQREMVERVEKEGLSRDEVKEAVEAKTGKKSKTKPGRPVTVKEYRAEAAKARVTIKFNKQRVSKADQIKALEEVLEQLRAA